VLTALAPGLGCLRPVVLEIAAAHPAAFSAGFDSALAVFSKVAGPATVLSPIVHHQFLSAGFVPASTRAIRKPTSALSLGFSLSGTIRFENSKT
jgi:hypothetical protein